MNVVCAFFPEAAPLVEELGLKKEPSSSFTLYQNKEHRLVVSGLGTKNITHAVSFLHQLDPQPSVPWLNIGIAGHGSAPIGSAHLVVKCTDNQTQKSIYPPQLFSCPLPKTILETVEKPVTEYKYGLAYDMEGYGYFKSASRHSSAELVQSVKVVSDNPDNPISHFDKSTVHEMISSHLPSIVHIINEMETLSHQILPDPEIELGFTKIFPSQPFTETQSHQLRKAVRQAIALGVPLSELEDASQHSTDSRSALRKINQLLDRKRLYS
jgi:hypothetical protein